MEQLIVFAFFAFLAFRCLQGAWELFKPQNNDQLGCNIGIAFFLIICFLGIISALVKK